MELFTPWHLVIVLIVAGFLFFGSKQLPDMSRSLGRSLRIFKSEMKGLTADDKAREEGKAADTTSAQDAGRELPATQIAPKQLPAATTARSAAPVGTAATSAARPRPRPRPVSHGTAARD